MTLVLVAAMSSMEKKMVSDGENEKITVAALFIDDGAGDSCGGSNGRRRIDAPLDA